MRTVVVPLIVLLLLAGLATWLLSTKEEDPRRPRSRAPEESPGAAVEGPRPEERTDRVPTPPSTSDPAGPAVVAAETAPLSDPARPGSERFHYERHLAALRALDPDDEAAAAEIVAWFHSDEISAPERVALLRASFDAPSPLCAELFLAALEVIPEESRPGLESVPEFALRYLGDRVGADPVVRPILEAALFERGAAIEAGPRRRAISKLVATASAEELVQLVGPLSHETDPLVLAGVAAELSRHPERETARRLARTLGLTLPAPDPDGE